MSADLFAEFGSSGSNAPASQQQRQQGHATPSTFSFFDDLRTPPVSAPDQVVAQAVAPAPNNAQQDADDTDDWGEFEGDTASFERPPLMKQDSFAFVAAAATRARAPTLSTTQEVVSICIPKNPNIYQCAVALYFISLISSQSHEASWQKAPVLKAKSSADPSVLFDAEDDFEDDDFGEFEEPEQTSADKPKVTMGSLGVSTSSNDAFCFPCAYS